MTSLEIGASVFFGIFSRYTVPLDQMLDFMECDGICIPNIASWMLSTSVQCTICTRRSNIYIPDTWAFHSCRVHFWVAIQVGRMLLQVSSSNEGWLAREVGISNPSIEHIQLLDRCYFDHLDRPPHETVGLPEGPGIFWHIPPARGERNKSTWPFWCLKTVFFSGKVTFCCCYFQAISLVVAYNRVVWYTHIMV